MLQSFLQGIDYMHDGFGLITKPGLRRYVMIPLMLNIIVFMFLFFTLRHAFGMFDNWFDSLLPAWLHWLSTVLWVLFFISFFLLFIYAFVTIGNIVCAPFNALLSEKVEFFLTGNKSAKTGMRESIRNVPQSVWRQVAILGYYIPRAIILLILFFIPVIQTVAPVLWFLFNAWYMLLMYLDYPMENHRISFRDMRRWSAARKGESLGLGVSMLAASMVPVLNFIAIPASVAAATVFRVKSSGESLK